MDMKITKGLAIVSITTILLGACFDPPDYPNKPEIIFQELVFRETPGANVTDSLVITIRFTDGDGDVGLHPDVRSFPFHKLNFYAGNGTSISAVGTNSYIDLPFELLLTDNIGGKLITLKQIRTNPAYDTFPRYEGIARCLNFFADTISVAGAGKALVEKSTIVDSLIFSGRPVVYHVADTFYIQSNPNHYNLEIDFLTKDPNVPGDRDSEGFAELDWRQYSPLPGACGETFDARVPVLGDSKKALDGTIRYAMQSVGFRDILKNYLLKLRIRLRDRSLNISNEIKTPAFTLDDIKR